MGFSLYFPGVSHRLSKKEDIFMQKQTRSRALYDHPFSKQYWIDAASELKNTRILVVAALMIALRVAMKGLSITIAPNLYINTAFIANALGAMIFGPVVAIPAAVVSDFLGFLIFPQGGTVYFLPYVLVEIAGSVIFALLLYRAKLTPTRVIISRFLICLLVNILLSPAITMWYYALFVGKPYMFFQIPHIIKSLAFFPIESWVLSFVLSVLVPVCYRLGLTFDPGPGNGSMKFTGKQIAVLAVLLAVGIGCTVGYLFYYYDNNSMSANYTASERVDANHMVDTAARANIDGLEDTETVSIVEAAYVQFARGKTTYQVAVYKLDREAFDANVEAAVKEDPKSKYGESTLWGYSKSKAAKDTSLVRLGTATIVMEDKTGNVLEFSFAPVK